MDKSSPAFTVEEQGVGKCPDCSVEIGTVLDGEDCTLDIAQVYPSEEEAQAACRRFTAGARRIESDRCEITDSVTQTADGWLLTMKLVFCCQAEKVIFQLSQR